MVSGETEAQRLPLSECPNCKFILRYDSMGLDRHAATLHTQVFVGRGMELRSAFATVDRRCGHLAVAVVKLRQGDILY